jgi:predicted phosphodiesterase
MKVIAIGDYHLRTDMLTKAKRVYKKHNPDMMIFLGDIQDSKGKSTADIKKSLQKFWDFVNSEKNIYVLVGNHDLGAAFGYEDKSSGHTNGATEISSEYWKSNKKKWTTAKSVDNWLFTHGGVCNSWLIENGLKSKHSEKTKAIDAADFINNIAKKHPEDLDMAGAARGGWHLPSPIWADLYGELINDPAVGFNQVVAHTPVQNVDVFLLEKNFVIGIDSWEKNTDNSPYGNQGFLLLDTVTNAVESI